MTYEMMNDLCLIEPLQEEATERISSIILSGVEGDPDDPGKPAKKKIHKGRLLQCGPGEPEKRNPNRRLPMPLHLPGWEPGCTVYYQGRFSRAELGGQLIVNAIDVMAREDEEGNIYPAYDYCLLNSPRGGGLKEGKGIFVVQEEKTHEEQPLAEGLVQHCSPFLLVKRTEIGELEEIIAVAMKVPEPGSRVLFDRYAAWRVFGKETTDHQVLVPCGHLKSVVPNDAEIDLCKPQ